MGMLLPLGIMSVFRFGSSWSIIPLKMKKFFKVVRRNLIAGLVLLAPAFITVYIVFFLIRLASQNWITMTLTEQIFDLLPAFLREGSVRFYLSQLIALLLVAIVIVLIGAFVRSYLGRPLYRLGEKILVRIPLFNRIYIQVRQVGESIFSQRETMFDEVVLLEYPRKGLYCMGFITTTVPKTMEKRKFPHFPGDPIVAIFIPTTPNPTSGVLIFSPRSAVTVLSMSIADAMKLIISAGAVYPGDTDLDDRPTLLDKLEQWITRETSLEPVHPPSPPMSND